MQNLYATHTYTHVCYRTGDTGKCMLSLCHSAEKLLWADVCISRTLYVHLSWILCSRCCCLIHQVMSSLSEEDYRSGKCFQTAASCSKEPVPRKPTGTYTTKTRKSDEYYSVGFLVCYKLSS